MLLGYQLLIELGGIGEPQYEITGFGFLVFVIPMMVAGGLLLRKYDRDKKKLDKYSCPYCNYVGTSEGELQKHNPKKHIQKSPHTWHFYVGIWLLIIAGLGVFVLFFLYDNFFTLSLHV